MMDLVNGWPLPTYSTIKEADSVGEEPNDFYTVGAVIGFWDDFGPENLIR